MTTETKQIEFLHDLDGKLIELQVYVTGGGGLLMHANLEGRVTTYASGASWIAGLCFSNPSKVECKNRRLNEWKLTIETN